ncbi:MAG TPA: tetratricopeptide repeat protein [Pyrinomonadaceae bacterium]
MEKITSETAYEFGEFRVDVGNRLVLKAGEPVDLAPKVVETLIALIRRRGEIVRKDELMSLLWPETNVAEANLTQNIHVLRKTLTNGSSLIETIPRRGYRFIGDVTVAQELPATTVTNSTRPIESQVANSRVASLALTLALILSIGSTIVALWSQTNLSRVFYPQPTASSANALANEKYDKATYMARKGTTQALEESIQQFDEAIKSDSRFALAYAGLSRSYSSLSSHYDSQLGQTPLEILGKAKVAALKSVELDDSLADAHVALGIAKLRSDFDWTVAETELKRATELNPNNAEAHHQYALLCSSLNRNEEARAEILRAQQLAPASMSIAKTLGDIYFYERDYDQAIEQFRRTIEIDPSDPFAASVHRALGWCYEFRGMHEQALAEFIEASKMQNAGPARLATFRSGYDKGGMKGYWDAWLKLQTDRIERGQLNPANLAQAYSFIDERDQAFACLSQALNDHTLDVAALRHSPAFDELRKDIRYKSLLSRLGLS